MQTACSSSRNETMHILHVISLFFTVSYHIFEFLVILSLMVGRVLFNPTNLYSSVMCFCINSMS